MSATPGRADEVIVACIQTNPRFGDVEGNLVRQRALIGEAVAAGARLIVLPECSTTGWCFRSRSEAAGLAEDVGARSGPALSMWLEVCERHDVHVVAGIVESNGRALYNTAVLVGPSGLIGNYRKTHLWGLERAVYDPGDVGFPVYETPLGRVGMHICYDAWFPESARLAAIQGADIVCVPANWVPVPTQSSAVPAMANMLCMTAAHTNLVYIAAASRVGTERDQVFIGRSVIIDHTGAPLAGPASATREEMIAAVVAPVASRVERRGNPFNQPLRDRRLDLYDEVLGSRVRPGEY